MISRYKPLLLSLSFLTLYALTIVFAVPPLSQYTPGETLDPSCAPGDTNCSVLLSSGWGLTGNAGTDPSTNFIGTTDNQDVVIRRNNAQIARFYSDRLSIGANAGNAYSSNFFGENAGFGATDVSHSNFFGASAGFGATNASYSNFFGLESGRSATDASYSNFFGASAGFGAGNATSSNFFGAYAGQYATDAYSSNFLGVAAGQFAGSASYSNFFGQNAGESAATASHSNFFGAYAGQNANNASHSNFFGAYAGQNANNVSYSNFFGYNAGRTFIGNNIGANNIIIGTNISLPDATVNGINLGGVLFGTGTYATTTGDPSITPVSGGRIGIGVVSPVATLDINGDTIISGSSRYLNFGTTSGSGGYGFRDNAGTVQFKNNAGVWANIGASGWGLTGNSGTDPSTNFIGTTDNQDFVIRRNNQQIARFYFDRLSIGVSAGNASNSNFIGQAAGNNATSAFFSNFFGSTAGINATLARDSNFFGRQAGQNATNASYSNFFGEFSGLNATSAIFSNFFGRQAGQNATNASYSNFFGSTAGGSATNAQYSNFFGELTGWLATDASYSNLFGFNAGRTFTGNNIGSNNIIIGTNISLPNATANGINLGGILFGTNTYSTTTGDPSIVPVNTGRIGIATIPTTYTLEVGNNTISGIVARFQNSTGTCDINPTTTSLVCSSDETLKSNITSLDSSLTSLSALRPVTYSWNSDSSNTPQVGFIAQEVEQIFPNLVFTDTTTGLKSLAYTNLIPYTVKAIQDIDMKVQAIESFDEVNESRFVLNLRVWLANASNKITRIFTGELCLVDEGGAQECINRAELQQLKGLLNQTQPQTVNMTTPKDSEISRGDDVAPADTSTDDQDDKQEEVFEIINIDEIAEPVE